MSSTTATNTRDQNSIVAVAEKNAVTTDIWSLSSIVTVVKETWLLPAFSGLYTVRQKTTHQTLARNFAKD